MDDESAKRQDTTKTLTLSPTGSSKTPSSVTAPTPATSSYYLGCRKGANCHCEICLASIDATRDLLSRTRLSSKDRNRPFVCSSPRAASPQARSTVTAPVTPPLLRSTAKSRPFYGKKVEKQEVPRVVGYRAFCLAALLSVLWVVDSGVVLKWFSPQLEREMVGRIGEESRVLTGDLNARVRFVQERLKAVVKDNARVQDCGARESIWELHQVSYVIFSSNPGFTV